MPRALWTYPWAPADYRADTRHLTREQHVAYREILDEIFLSGQHESPPSIPDDDRLLESIAMAKNSSEWKEIRAVLIDGPRAVLQSQCGRISQKRMTAEIERALDKCQKAQQSARTRWAEKSPERSPDAPGSTNRTERGSHHAGNGNGQAMSRKQYLFFATKIGKWKLENEHLFVGNDGLVFEAAFQREFGLTWQAWQREFAIHANA